MNTSRKILSAAALLTASTAASATRVAADDHGEDSETLFGILDGIQELVDGFAEFTGNLDDILVEAGLTLFVKPFQLLAQTLSDTVTYLLVSYPNVTQPGVLEVHWTVYQITLLLAVPAFIWVGFRHMTNRVDGLRPTVRLLGLLVAGGLAPWLLHYPVRLSQLTTAALQPGQASIVGTLNVALLTAVVIWLKAAVLLIFAILYLLRDFYLLFYTVSFPLVLLLGFFKPTQKHAGQLTDLFIGFLLIAPLDMIAYRLVLVLLSVDTGSPLPNYITGVAGYFALLAIPYVVLSSGTSITLPALMAAKSGATRVGDRVKPVIREKARQQYTDWKQKGNKLSRQAQDRFHNRFRYDTVDVKTQEQAGGEIELQPKPSLRNATGKLHSRFTDYDEPVDVEIEDEWWKPEAEIKEKRREDGGEER
jgi:hypothetical protein